MVGGEGQLFVFFCLPGGSVVKNPVADVGLMPESARSPGEGNSNPLQYSCLGNPMDRGAWWAIVRGIAKSWTANIYSALTHTPHSIYIT